MQRRTHFIRRQERKTLGLQIASLAFARQRVQSEKAQSQQTSNSTGDGGAVGAFVAPAVGVEVGVGLACPICIAIGGALATVATPTAGDDTTINDNQAYVFHFTSQVNANGIILSGQISPGISSGVAWVTPTPYPSAGLAQSQLALQNTPQRFFAIPVQNLQTPLSWSTVQGNTYGPGGGVEGTTPLAIPLNGPGGPAAWVPFH
jgi:hypothetical protein